MPPRSCDQHKKTYSLATNRPKTLSWKKLNLSSIFHDRWETLVACFGQLTLGKPCVSCPKHATSVSHPSWEVMTDSLCNPIISEIEQLAEHGITLPPNMQGLTDEQVVDLKLKDEWADKCTPSGGSVFKKDDIGRRNGNGKIVAVGSFEFGCSFGKNICNILIVLHLSPIQIASAIDTNIFIVFNKYIPMCNALIKVCCNL